MTVLTKPISEKKLTKPLMVTDANNGSECLDVGIGNNADGHDVEMWLSPSVRRRISTTTTVCVFVTALVVMSIGIIGGVYLYRQVTQHQRMSRFRGWCGIPYERESLHFPRKHTLLGPNRPFFKENTRAQWISSGNYFKEEFDLDLDTGLFAKISIPDFGYGRKAQFLHDFSTNKTGIIIHEIRKCYVMPLDRRYVKPPRDLFDLVRKVWMGYYDIDTQVITKRMKVIHPAIADLQTQGKYIANHCSTFRSYILEEIVDEDRRKRSIHEDEGLTIAEFAGKNIVEFIIEDDQDPSSILK